MLFAADNAIILSEKSLDSTSCQLLVQHTEPFVVAIRAETILKYWGIPEISESSRENVFCCIR
jgi:hypothetical protein